LRWFGVSVVRGLNLDRGARVGLAVRRPSDHEIRMYTPFRVGSAHAAVEVAEEEPAVLVALEALSLHRIQLLGIVEGAPPRGLGRRAKAHRIGLLSELLHGSMFDQHRDEVAHGPVLQPMTLDVDDLPYMLSRERRKPRCESIHDALQVLVLIKPTHLDSLRCCTFRDHPRSVNFG
jgi:hypothetical protein